MKKLKENMNNYEFMSYIETTEEKYIGIATIRIDRRFVVRFKVFPKKDSSGYYIQPPSMKVTVGGLEKYVLAFQADSVLEAEDVKTFLEIKINDFYQKIKSTPRQTDPKLNASDAPNFNDLRQTSMDIAPTKQNVQKVAKNDFFAQQDFGFSGGSPPF